jgi:hypothetical protein
MAISLHEVSVISFLQTLSGAATVLDRGLAHQTLVRAGAEPSPKGRRRSTTIEAANDLMVA